MVDKYLSVNLPCSIFFVGGGGGEGGLVSGEEVMHLKVDKYLSVNLSCLYIYILWGWFQVRS